MTRSPTPSQTAPATPARLPAAKRWPVALLALTLAACGGGGGGDSTASPSPSPAPTPAPTPPAPATVAPSITTQPADVGVIAPAAAAFTVAVSGTPAPTIQWQKSAGAGQPFANVAGATSATLSLSSTSVADTLSQYQAVVTNSVGTTTSRAATLTVTAAAVAPVITSQPSPVTVTAPASATFTVSATASPTVSYQWQLSTDNGITFTNIAGAVAATYNTPATAVANSGQVYRVVVSNGQTSVNSNPAALTVSAGAPGTASACTGAASYAAGFTYDVVYSSPSATGTFTTTTHGNVVGAGTFHGQSATDIYEHTMITAPGSAGTVLDTKTDFYRTFAAGTAQLTQYGSSAVVTDLSGTSTNVDTYYNPPSTDARFTLNAGGTTTVTTHQIVTLNTSAPTTSDETDTVVFGGVETLTVPAGTYQSCKFTTTTSNNTVTTTWLLVGSGVQLKTVTGSAVSEATSIRINGLAP